MAGAAEKLSTEVLTDLESLVRLTDAWRGLFAVSPSATAFASPAWLLPWYRHFERPGGIQAVAVWRGAQLVGLAPFAQSRIGGRRSGFRLLVSAGAEHGGYGDPLLGPDPAASARAIADTLTEVLAENHAVVNLRRLDDGSALLRALETGDDIVCAPSGRPGISAVVRFDTMDDPAAQLETFARRHDIPRRMRRLREEHGEVAWCSQAGDIDATLDAMRDMLAHRWEPGTGPRLFTTPTLESFTRAVHHAAIEDGLARLSTLNADGRPVAVSSLLRVGPRHISEAAAYDPALARFGLGQAELYETLRQSLAEGASEVDLRGGEYAYKLRWANARRIRRSVTLVAPGKAGDMAIASRRLAMSLRARQLRRREQT